MAGHALRRQAAIALVFLPLLLPPGVAGKGSLFPHSALINEFIPDTFTETVLADDRIFVVDYYADWCPHCIQFAPVYEKMAGEYKHEGKRLVFAALNCAAYSSFCSDLGVKGFPTIRVYHVPGLPKSAERGGEDIDWRHSENKLKEWIGKTLASLPPAADPPAAEPAIPPPTEPQEVKELPKQTSAGKSAEAAANGSHSAAPSKGNIPATEDDGGAALHLIDAEVALLYALRQAPTFAADADSGVIQGEALAELQKSLTFFANVIPSARAREDVAFLAAFAQNAPNGELDREAWIMLLEERGIDGVPPQAGRDPDPFWRHCATYTCGLWSLFHIAVVSASEVQTASGFLSFTSAPMPGEALERIRGFVNHFFGCTDCVTHFLESYDKCQFNRCSLEPADGKSAALWLWRVHNSVTQRVASENGQQGKVWPSTLDCPGCWPDASDQTSWDAAAVYSYIKGAYWQPEWQAVAAANAGGFAAPEVLWGGSAIAMLSVCLLLWRLCGGLMSGGEAQAKMA